VETITQDDYAIDIIACFQKDIMLFTEFYLYLSVFRSPPYLNIPSFGVSLRLLIVSSENQDNLRSRTANPNAGKGKLD